MNKGDIIILERDGEERDAVIVSISGDNLNVEVSPYVSKIDNGNQVFKWDKKNKEFKEVFRNKQ